MKNKIMTITVFVITAAIIGLYPVFNKPAKAIAIDTISSKPKIQIAILLDTSSSMSGLINQARNQLWQVVNEFSTAEKDGEKPELEVAVYEYGNNRLSSSSGYIRQVTPLTGELDQVSEALFSLTTNGGNEFCGYVIKTAVNGLNWSKSNNDIKAIFIAGNEPFTQGPVNFRTAIQQAKEKGITVNTIHAGPTQAGANSGWKAGAMLAGGDFMSINHNHVVAHITAPQDKRIAELNKKLNNTYIPYGKEGREKAERQRAQDEKSQEISSGLMSKRARAKISSMYNNSTWDLVDAIETGKVKLEEMDAAALPAPMRSMPREKQEEYVQEKVQERKKIKEEIGRLSLERSDYVKKKKQDMAKPGVATVNDAVSSAIRKEAEKKNYKLN